MAEKKNALEKEFETKKQEMLESFPQYKDEIGLTTNMDELNDAYKQIQEDAKDDTKKMVVEHLHKIITEKDEDDDEEDEGSPSIHKGGSDLSKTGGKVPLLEGWGIKPSTDPTKSGESARKIIDAIITEKEALLWKQEQKKGLTPKEQERLRVLEAKQRQYWRSLAEGYKNRGIQRSYFQAWTCPICKSFCHTHQCPTCNYRQGTKIDKEKQDQWLILKGEKR